MARFVARRLLGMVAVLFAISVIVFLIFNVIPNSDPAARIAGKNADPALIARVNADLGLDKPLPVQYLTMMKQIFTGQLTSYAKDRNVVQQIWDGVPATFSLCIGAAVIWMSLAMLFGYLSAVHAGKFTDRALTILSLAGISMPVFWLAAMLLYFLTFKVELFPTGSYVPLTEDPVDWAYHLILPWFTLAVLFVGFYSRVLRSNMLDAMNEDYVRTARAKGLSERQVRIRHVLRNSMIPDRHAVRARLRAGGRRRRDPHRDGVQPDGVGLYAGEAIRSPGSAAADGGDDVRRVLHRAVQHDRRHPVRGAGSADPTGRGGARMSAILKVDDLRVSFATEDGVVRPSTASHSSCRRARCWPSSANPAAAKALQRRRSPG